MSSSLLQPRNAFTEQMFQNRLHQGLLWRKLSPGTPGDVLRESAVGSKPPVNAGWCGLAQAR